MIFASPGWLLALLLLPLALAGELWLVSRDRERLARMVSRPLWSRGVRRRRERWRWLRLALLLAGALAVIVAHWRRQADEGGAFLLAGARYRYTKALWITGLADRLPMYDTVGEALAALAENGSGAANGPGASAG